MSFQNSVKIEAAPAVPGDRAGINPAVYACAGARAGGNVRAGRFVWRGAADGHMAPKVSCAAIASADGAYPDVYGFVERTLAYSSFETSLDIPEGAPVTVAVKGDYWAVTSTDASVGDKIFANVADGSVSARAAGSTADGWKETGWTAQTAGKAGDLIIISAWSE